MEKNVTHTPGPWRLSTRRPCDIYDEDGRYIGTTYGNYERQTPPHVFATDQANARLMAEAPSLLNALRRIIRCHDEGCDEQWERLMEIGRAAVAKATGATNVPS